jgi:hypothetical protein
MARQRHRYIFKADCRRAASQIQADTLLLQQPCEHKYNQIRTDTEYSLLSSFQCKPDTRYTAKLAISRKSFWMTVSDGHPGVCRHAEFVSRILQIKLPSCPPRGGGGVRRVSGGVATPFRLDCCCGNAIEYNTPYLDRQCY